MGFLDSVMQTLNEGALDIIIARWRQMSDSELVDEWNNKVSEIPFDDPERDIYKNPNLRDLKALDEIYGERSYTNKTWHRMKEEFEENRNKCESFKSRLANNAMVSEIIKQIDELGETAYYIEVFSDCVVCQDDEEEDCLEILFKKHHYPDLEDYQIDVLLRYIQEKVSLKYDEYSYDDDSGYFLELSEESGGTSESW